MGYFSILFSALAALATVFAGIRLIHMLQLESYQGNMYIKWMKRAGNKDALLFFIVGLAAFFLHLAWLFLYHVQPVLSTILWYLGDVGYLAGMVYIGIVNRKLPAKKKIVFTSRVKRLMVMLALLAALFHFGLFIPFNISAWGAVLLYNLLRYLPGLLLPIFVLLAHVCILPVENAIKRWYYNDAKRKLDAREDVIKIGITGSYGKTSTKFILGAILKEKWPTLVTPNSYNTPMGITRVIREQLEPSHRVFVAEMGARYRGDINELCNLVRPRYGIITSVGKQHLETFGTYEQIIVTKAELLNALPKHGAAFINGDNTDCRRMYTSCKLQQKYLFGIDGSDLYLRAADIQVGSEGSTFTLVDAEGESISCKTRLLGRHNILNITGAAALAKFLGLTMEEIAAGIEKLEPVEHRLQLIPGAVTVIDDAFNANPAGTKAALEVLRAFAPTRRIIVTPGMIELGDEEEALHEAFGRDIAEAADIAILVGEKRVDPIHRGLLAAGFEEPCIIRVKSLGEATELLPVYTQPGCVVLFENDLPDNYDNA